MGVFSRSWDITKSSFSVMKKEGELFIFPILSSILSLILLAAITIPIILSTLGQAIVPEFGVITLILIAAFYFGTALIATFFNFCVVHTAALAFSGRPAHFWSTIGRAFSKLHIIIGWALLAATVGLILKILENAARNAKGVGKILLLITQAIFGLAWTLANIFVIQSMVYKASGPFTAIKESIYTLKKTWGESLVRYFGLGLAQFIVMLPVILIGIGVIALGAFSGSIAIIVIGVLFLIVMLVAIGLFFGVANQIFNTALYVYAQTGYIPNGFNEDQLRNAFKQNNMKLLR